VDLPRYFGLRSVQGQKPISNGECSMSAPPPKADIQRQERHVRKVPKPAMFQLFDDIIGAGEQR
jgi:hypothetical protein